MTGKNLSVLDACETRTRDPLRVLNVPIIVAAQNRRRRTEQRKVSVLCHTGIVKQDIGR